jgi:catecholate siderophore receptor
MRRLRRSVEKSAARTARRRALVLAPALGALLASSSAFAQQPQGDIPLPPVDVRAPRREYIVPEADTFKLPSPILETPQSITVVPQQIIREQSVFNLRDILRNVTGISLAAGEGGGAQGDNLTLRGFSARNDIFLDGIRDFGFYTRDAFNLESVEVLKGPSSVMFGRGSTGGIINQVSKTPTLTPSYGASVTIGTSDFYRGSFDINQPIGGNAAVRATGMVQDSDVAEREHTHIQRLGLAPTFTIGLNGPTRLTLGYFHIQDHNIPDYGVPFLLGVPAPVDRRTNYVLLARDRERDQVHIATARLEHAFNEELRLRNTFRFAYYSREATVSPPRIVGTPGTFTPLTTIQVSRAGTARDTEDTNITNATDVIVKFPTGPLKHTLVTGVEIGYESSDVRRWAFNNVPNATLIDPNPRPDLSGVTRLLNFTGDTDAFSFGVYAVDELAITEQWKLLGGLRYDLFDATFKSQIGGTKFSRTDEMISPRAALVFQPTTAQTYYFSYGTSFNPSAEALSLAVNNANTDPEETRTFEIGAKGELFGGALTLRGAAFEIQKTNARTNDPATGIQVLEGEQRVRGFELEAIGRPLPRWNVFAGYTYLDSRVTESLDINNGVPVKGKRIQNVPVNTLSLWTTYDINDRWQVGGGVFVVDSRFADAGNTNEAPGYARGDITVAYRPVSQLELRLNVINLTDETYFDQVHPAHIVPGAGRTFLFTGNVRF